MESDLKFKRTVGWNSCRTATGTRETGIEIGGLGLRVEEQSGDAFDNMGCRMGSECGIKRVRGGVLVIGVSCSDRRWFVIACYGGRGRKEVGSSSCASSAGEEGEGKEDGPGGAEKLDC